MEEFMTMMIEESEPLNLELVDLLVTSVRKEKQVILITKVGSSFIHNYMLY